jgi:hypothetical protein
MTVELSPAGARYLLDILRIDLRFYEELAGLPQCSQANRDRWELVKGLRDNLTQALIDDASPNEAQRTF